MSPLNSWLLIISIFSTIGFVMAMLYARGQDKYVEHLQRMVEESNPPF